MSVRWLVVAVVWLLAGGCSDGSAVTTGVVSTSTSAAPVTTALRPTTAPTSTTSTTAGSTRFQYIGTVLESPDHGPVACAGIVLMSLPPICSGVPVVGLGWDVVSWAESARGTTWAEVVLVGSFDGEQLTLQHPPEPVPADHVGAVPIPDWSAPCVSPPDGWADTRPDTVDTSAARSYAENQADFGGHWIFRPQPSVNEVVQVFSFTGDLATHEQRLREVYSGALCVALAPRTLAEAEVARHDLKTRLWSAEARAQGIVVGYPGLPYGGVISMWILGDAIGPTVEVTVVAVLEPEGASAWLDSLYGPGTVHLTPVLTTLAP